MFNNIRMISNICFSHFSMAFKRKKYTYGNAHYEVAQSRAEVFKLMKRMCQRMIKSSKMDLVVRGEENLPKEGPVLYVANHKSIFDIVVLTSILKEPCIFVGKKEVAQMPLINKWFESLGCIYLDREDKRKSLQSIIKGIEELKGGQSIVIFPEGTRHSGDCVMKFKEGSFKLATKSGVPIIPIALHNTYKVFEEHRAIRKATVTVNIGKMIETKDLTKEEVQQLPSRTEEYVRELMEEIIAVKQK